ncbi:hypothetical protein AAVH_26506 [Aphelenchoides avenae]|nr:hypothetical protein AAVH_26506 [Aphelenchus avenae]
MRALLLGFLCYIPSGAQEIVAYNEPVTASSESTQKGEDKAITEVTSTDVTITEVTLEHGATNSSYTEGTNDQRQSSSPTFGDTDTKNASTSPYAEEQSGRSANSMPTTSNRYSDGTLIPPTKSKATSEISVGPKSDGTQATTTETGKAEPTDSTLAGTTVLDENATDESRGQTMASHGHGTDSTSHEAIETTAIKGTHGTISLDKANSGRTAATTSLYPGRVKTTYEASNESETTASSDVFNDTLSSDNWNATTSSPAESPCGKTDGSECSTQEIIDQNVKKCKRIFIISFVISLAILMAYTVFSGLHGMLRKKSKKL